jgi:hypothetical protein
LGNLHLAHRSKQGGHRFLPLAHIGQSPTLRKSKQVSIKT